MKEKALLIKFKKDVKIELFLIYIYLIESGLFCFAHNKLI